MQSTQKRPIFREFAEIVTAWNANGNILDTNLIIKTPNIQNTKQWDFC